MEEKKKVSDTLSEEPIFIMAGLLPILVRPATLSQIYEVGAILEKVSSVELRDKVQPMLEMMARYKDLKVCTEIFITLAFRSKIKRALFGWYVRKTLTMQSYQKLLEFAAETFSASFFLISFTFLKGTKEITNPTNTNSATVLGDSLEE